MLVVHSVGRFDDTEAIAKQLMSYLMSSAEKLQTKGSGYSFEKVSEFLAGFH